MYPGPNVPRHGKSLWLSPIYPYIVGVYGLLTIAWGWQKNTHMLFHPVLWKGQVLVTVKLQSNPSKCLIGLYKNPGKRLNLLLWACKKIKITNTLVSFHQSCQGFQKTPPEGQPVEAVKNPRPISFPTWRIIPGLVSGYIITMVIVVVPSGLGCSPSKWPFHG